MKKKYVSEIMIGRYFEKGHFNMIVAPCGSGKTTYFCKNVLPHFENKSRIIYLVDTQVLEESLLEQYGDIFQQYNPEVREITGLAFWSETSRLARMTEKCIVMTYAKFGSVCKANKDEKFLKKIELIVCDERSTKAMMMKKFPIEGYAGQYDNTFKEYSVHYYGLKKIIEYTKSKKLFSVFMTATPARFEHLMKDMFKEKLHYVVDSGELEGYETKETREFENINNFINGVTQRGDKGYTVATLWSINNEDNPMDDFSVKVREHMIANKEIREDIDILIINSAYETGFDILDTNDSINNVVVNSRVYETITQVRERVRHNLDTLITLTKESSDRNLNINMDVLNKYIDKPLDKAMKHILVNELDLKNEKGRQMKWTSIKKYLIDELGYKVESHRTRVGEEQVRRDYIYK